jgi:hypothetical protein
MKTTFEISLAIRYNRWSNGTTRNSLCCGFDDRGLAQGIDYKVTRTGQRFGYWVVTATSEESFKKMMAARWGLGSLQREEVQVMDATEVAALLR